MNLSFSGCGFLGIYHLGVAKTFSKEGKTFISKVKRYGGASAGALIASLFAVHGADEEIVERCRQFSTNLAEEMNSKMFGVFTPGVELLTPIEKFMEELFPEDAHLRANGRLFISVTNTDTQENELISEFSSRENLIQFLLASSCIPHITAAASITIGNKKYCDGGLTDNLPNFPEGQTIKVSPFEGKHDISPSISSLCGGDDPHLTVVNQSFKVSLDNLMRGAHIFSPPSAAILGRYYHQGSEDARKFLIDRGYLDPAVGDGSMVNNNNNVPVARTTATHPPNGEDLESQRSVRSPEIISRLVQSFNNMTGKLKNRESSVDGPRAPKKETSVD